MEEKELMCPICMDELKRSHIKTTGYREIITVGKDLPTEIIAECKEVYRCEQHPQMLIERIFEVSYFPREEAK